MAFPMPGIVTSKRMIEVFLRKSLFLNKKVKDLFQQTNIITTLNNSFKVSFKSAGVPDSKYSDPQLKH
jgi:hypothetical protein